MRNTLFAFVVLFGVSAGAQEEDDPPGPDPLRISLTSGFSARTSSVATGPVGSVVPVRFKGLTPPPTVRLSAAWFFLKSFGLALDGSGEWFSVGPQVADTGIERARFVSTFSASLGVTGRWVPTPVFSIEAQLGYMGRGLPILSVETGALTNRLLFSHGPYGALVVGLHPEAPFALLGWARGMPFSLESGAPAGTRSTWYAFGAQASLGRLALLSLRWSLVVEYEVNVSNAFLSEGQVTTTDFRLSHTAHSFSLGLRAALPNPPLPKPVVVEPPKTGSLLGQVVGADGAPVWKAKVKVAGGAAIETDANGGFAVAAVPVGEAAIDATAEGFKPAQSKVTIVAGEQATPTVTLQRPTGPGRLKGKVLLADPDRPAVGAEVKIAGGTTVQVGADGTYKVEPVGPGPVSVEVSAVGYVAAQELVQVPAEGEATLDVKLSNKKPNAVLRGLVSAKSGALVSATVKVKQKNLQVTVGADGRFSIELPGGRYDIVVEAPGYRSQTRTIDVGYGDQTIYHFELRPLSQ